ncbi:MAG: ATP-binding protein [Nitrolancea sp.]
MAEDDIQNRLRVAPDQLRRHMDPASLTFQTTADVTPLVGTIGQPRAIDAIEFGLQIDTHGYNLFLSGSTGSGRESTILDYLTELSAQQRPPSDWIYVHNFADPDQPRSIELPSGRGVQFDRDMREFVVSAQHEIPRAFESEEYERRRRQALNGLTQQRDSVFASLQSFAEAHGFTLEMTPAGIVTIPVVNGKPITPEEFEKLPAEQKQSFAEQSEEIQGQISSSLRELRQIEKQAAARVSELDREIAIFVIGPFLEELRERYNLFPKILAYLEELQNDVPAHLHDFAPPPADQSQAAGSLPAAQLQSQQREEHLARYRVNVLIDNSQTTGAPIVFERNPTYYNLIGRIDYRATFGAMLTDFSQIKPGALHRANGGFLLLQAVDVLRSPFAWDALKRSLICREIRMENLGEQYSTLPTAALRPEPIPLKLKVVLIGPPNLYQSLLTLDEEFPELFKVKADFAPDMEWNDEHVQNYAAFISRHVRDAQLRHFDRGAVARVIEYGSRLREDQRKLSARLLEIANVVTESSYWAKRSGHDPVMASDVDTAIRKRVYRSNLVEERIREMIDNGTIMIDTAGERVGQVNGLAVLNLGDYEFGQPSRITARVSLGRGNIISVERETELSGAIHSKGVMILSGYLRGAYGEHIPLAASATITFEQSYSQVDGDSASSTELYALLSALSGLPLRQGVAVTGSVNQYGDVQAVGGVTHKIEGFFTVCKAQGLTGDQGVMIPKSNVPTLMLDEEIVQAVRDRKFSIWQVSTIDEGIELLTGVPAGTQQADGSYPEGTVHRLVEERLRHLAETARAFAAPQNGGRDTPPGVAGTNPAAS